MWKFNKREPGVPRVDPTEKEFFADEDTGQLTAALVRESIQNSLDARRAGSTVRVRYHIDEVYLSDSQLERFFGHLGPHVLSEGNGIRNPSSIFGNKIRFIAVEDFGTTGLDGDEKSDEVPAEGENNQFYYFWRHIGRGGKSGEDLGRWGLGKTVFAASSQIGSYLGVTRRDGEIDSLSMGISVLKHHFIDVTEYQPYGYLASHQPDGTPLPINDQQFAEEFAETFGLRRDEDSGLSVVVPYANPEITLDDLLQAVLQQFYFPIALGDLVVELSGAVMDTVTIDSDYLQRNLNQLRRNGRMLADQVDLALWFAQNRGPHSEIDPSRFDGDTEVDQVTKRSLESVKNGFEDYEPIAFRVPVEVHRQGKPTQRSFVTLIGKKGFGNVRTRVSFVRQGLTVPGIQVNCPTGTRFIVYANHGLLAEFLGDSENPSHTTWGITERVSTRYRYARRTIDEVRTCVARFYRLLLDEANPFDDEILQKFFPVPAEPNRKKGQKPSSKPGDEVDPPPPPPPSAAPRYSVSKADDGFALSGVDGSDIPEELMVRVAYDTSTGNPFTRYSRFDFQLNSSPIVVAAENCETKQKNGRMVVYSIHPGFSVSVSGFDVERDLITDVRVVK